MKILAEICYYVIRFALFFGMAVLGTFLLVAGVDLFREDYPMSLYGVLIAIGFTIFILGTAFLYSWAKRTLDK